MLSPKQLRALRVAPLDGPNKLRQARELADMTQVDLAAACGWPQTYISRIECGTYSRLPLENARILANHFGCPIEDLFPAREAVAS